MELKYFALILILGISHLQGEIIEQKPVDWKNFLQQPIGGYPKATKSEGVACRFSSECLSGCCSGQSRRTCGAAGQLGDSCSNFQVKGGAYPAGCPCAKGLTCEGFVCHLK